MSQFGFLYFVHFVNLRFWKKFTIFWNEAFLAIKIHPNGTPLVKKVWIQADLKMFLRESLFSSLINPCIYYNKLKSLEVKIKILTMKSLYINRTSPLVNDVLHPSNEFTMYMCSDDVILPISWYVMISLAPLYPCQSWNKKWLLWAF